MQSLLLESYAPVKLIDQIRRDNLDRLQKELGSLKKLADLVGRSESQVSQWKLGAKHSTTGKPRGMRSETARHIEACLGRPIGWMDIDHDAEPIVLFAPAGVHMPNALPDAARIENRDLRAPLRAWEYSRSLPPGDSVLIPHLEVSFRKLTPTGQATISLVKSNATLFDTDWIRQDQLQPDQQAWLEMTDDSMLPTLAKGDAVAIDVAQQTVVDGATFAIVYAGALRIRRLYGLPGGGCRVVADNSQRFEPIVLAADDIQIIGRAVTRKGRGALG